MLLGELNLRTKQITHRAYDVGQNSTQPPARGRRCSERGTSCRGELALQRDVAAAAAEQQARMSAALATTDPLVRLQLAGVNPEIPGLHPAYASLLGGPRGPPPGTFDPRIRSPGDLMSGLRPPPGFSPRPPALEMYQRQLMMGMERDHAIRHQHAATLMAQQEEFLRLEQEARARNADPRNIPHSRPP